MAVFNNALAGAAGSGGAAGYEIERSLRFDRVASSYIEAPTLTSGKDTYTISLWIKRTEFSSYYAIYSTGTTSSGLFFDSSNGISPSGFYSYFNSVGGNTSYTNEEHRDPSAWYHIVVSVNSSLATIYVNGVAQTTDAGHSAPNFGTLTDTLYFGIYSDSLQYPFDGYMADIHFIDGQALDKTDFGEFDDNGVWQPIKYAGTYGSEGFHLPLSDPGSVSALGRDDSGNGNHCTLYNITPLGQVSPESDVITATSSGSYTARMTSAVSDLNGGALTQNASNWSHFINASQNDWVASGWLLEITAGYIVQFNYNNATVGAVLDLYFGIDNVSNITIGGDILNPSTFVRDNTGGGTATISSQLTGSAAKDALLTSTTRKQPIKFIASSTSGSFTITTDQTFYLYGHAPFDGTLIDLTLSSDKDLAKFSAGEFVKQDDYVSPFRVGNYSSGWNGGTDTIVAVGDSFSTVGNTTAVIIDTALLPSGWSLKFTKTSGTNNLDIYQNSSATGSGSPTGLSNPVSPITASSGYSRYLTALGSAAGNVNFTISGTLQGSDPSGTFISANTAANTMTVADSSGTWSSNTSNYVIGPNTLSSTPDVDTLRDSPTNGDTANDTGLGGEIPSNYCTWNVLSRYLNRTDINARNGNLEIAPSQSYTYAGTISGTIAIPKTGKWYWEVGSSTSAFNSILAGLETRPQANYAGSDNGVSVPLYAGGSTYAKAPITVNPSTPSWAIPNSTSDIFGFAIDMDAGEFYLYYNGVIQNNGNYIAKGLDLVTEPLFPSMNSTSSCRSITNFGQRPFAYPLAGYKALCTANLPEPTIEDGSTAMDVVTYTGNGTSQTISGLGFSPDLVWIKNRADAADHRLYDAVRGAANELIPNLTLAEATDVEGLSAFTSDGFSVGVRNPVNGNGDGIVAWTWDAGETTDPANTDGSITSSVRANPSAGFSIVSYTGTGNVETVGHGLNASPAMIIVKDRDNTYNWMAYHQNCKNAAAPNAHENALRFSLDNAMSTNNSYPWLNPPTSTVFTENPSYANFSVGLLNTDYIAYCFAPVEGYSAFGSYVGNSSADGPFVYTGHRSRWLMVKRIDDAYPWAIFDTARDTYNPVNGSLAANRSDIEAFYGGAKIDYLSNGFKLRGADNWINGAGTYIYAAFAEHPFKYARAR